MNFANTYLKSFGHCKVLSWKCSVYSDFERKELTYRGRLLASVEVPTVRKIDALVLVRANSKSEVQQKLNDIANWLYSAGTDKLFAESDNTYYYIARCTQISTPEYNGNSARVTVTFTCADNRLYTSYNNQPITTATSEMNNFTFDGKHCLNDMGCVFVMDIIDAVPGIYANKYEISGMSGTLRYSSGEIRFREKQMSGSLYFVKPTANDGLLSDAEIMERLHKVSSWLGNAERASLILDSDISRKYDAEIIDGASLSNKDWENGSVKVKFILQPFASDVSAKSYSGSVTLTANTITNVSMSSLIPDGIGATTPLIVSIKNNGNSPISSLRIYYYDEKDTSKYILLNGSNFSLASGENIIVNSVTGEITKGADQGIKWLKSGDFPVLSVNGTKSIGFYSDVGTTLDYNVTLNVRWL